MPQIIEYPDVVKQMSQQGLISLYPNSGAFGFPKGVAAHAVGWVGGDDPTIRPEARALTATIAPPIESTLARLADHAWQSLLPGPVWVMPKAHWAYELDFGSSAWMPGLLGSIGVAADQLSPRHDGTAVGFEPHESAGFRAIVEGLLTHLLGSDFQLAFPGHDACCTVHHHKQLWWTSPDERLIGRLREFALT